MRLFAPRNEWSATAPRGVNFFGMTGQQSSSGVRVSQDSSMTFSAVFAAHRIISETLASLPCKFLEQVDDRTTKNATTHRLWSLFHDQPNPEQDIMSWLDSQVAFQVGWGNAFAEKQRNSLREIIALWQIHPSRIPVQNIYRNPTDPRYYNQIVAGKPGEIVFYVNNDDGSKSPIAASDMFHVPGVLSQNGITGQSIPMWAANSIGIAIATETHAGAVFKNGALSNMVLVHPKTLSEQAANRLRDSWQKTYGGVDNHYKTLITEEGMEPKPIDMSPEVTQLIEARQFSINEIARWYRLPPHLLGDLSRSTNNNIEAQGLEFIIYSMLPWIVRWEKAMQRQLLTPDEQKRYRFKFNVNGLLRGDQAARAQFYQTMFNLGAFSPNDIRGCEDLNPIDGGDQYFVQGNNAVPLDKINELAQSTIDKNKDPAPQPAVPKQAPDETKQQAHLKELREQMVAMIAEHETAIPGKVASAVNLRASEDAQRREMQAETALESVRDALALAIQAEVEQLMRYEARAARDAAKKPQTFLSWRDDFYAKFTPKLATAIGIFVTSADKIGVLIDNQAEAEAYSLESISNLDKLGDLSCDKLEHGVEQMVQTWDKRPQQLAESLFRSAV